MKGTGIALIVVGGLGLVASGMMFGDIGIAGAIGSVTALISGVGFVRIKKPAAQ